MPRDLPARYYSPIENLLVGTICQPGLEHCRTVRPSHRRYSPRADATWSRRGARRTGSATSASATSGGKTECVRVEEVPDQEKPPILRAYLKEWAWEVKQFFGGVGADAPDAELLRITPRHPVFRIIG